MHKIFFIVMFFLSAGEIYAQCIEPAFSIRDNGCLNESLPILNNTVSGSFAYSWDFCSGDLMSAPGASNSLVNSNFFRARSIRFIKEGDNWHAFSISATGNILMRLDFGNDPESTPSFYALGNINGYLSSSFSFDVVKSNGIWHLFVANGGNKNILRFSFDNGITNPPSAEILETPLVFDVTGPNFLRIVEDAGIFYAFVAVGSSLLDSKIVRLRFGSSILALSPETSEFSVSGGNQLRGLSFVKECGGWIAFALSTNTNSLYRLNFDDGLDNAPVSSLVNTGSTVLNTPVNIEIRKEGGLYYAFIQNARIEEINAALYRITFGESLNGSIEQADRLQMPELTGGAYALDVIEDSSSWNAFTFNLANQSLVRMDFSGQCPASPPVSVLRDPETVLYTSPGNYRVSLNVEDADGNVYSTWAGVAITSAPAPDIDFISENVCANHDMNFIAVSTADNIESYSWNFGDGNTAAESNPAHQYASAGTFDPSLNVMAINGCRNYVSRSVTVYDPPGSEFTTPPGLLCTNNLFTFSNDLPDLYNGYLSYQWLVDDIPVSTDRDLHYTFTTTGPKVIKLITSIPGCSDEMSQTTSPVETGPVVDFSFTGTCEEDVFTFRNEISDPVEGFLWDFDNGSTSNDPNPSQVFTSFGDYSVSLTATNAIGCENIITRTVPIHSKPLIDFSANGPPNACSETPALFQNQTTNPDGREITEWLWDFNDPGNPGPQNESNPEHVFQTPDTYSVSLTATTASGCEGTGDKSILIHSSPSTEFSHTPACDDVPVMFAGPDDPNIIDAYWEIGTSYYLTNSPAHTFLSAGDYPLYLEVTSSNGCISSRAETIHVPVALSPDFSVLKNCVNQEAVFSDITTGIDPVVATEWSIDQTQTFTGSPLAYTFSQEGSQNITLAVTAESGCRYETGRQVEILSAPVASFSANPAVGAYPLEVAFTNTSTDAIYHQWEFSDGTGTTSTESSPVYTFVGEGTFDVKLTTSNQQECEDIYTGQIVTVAPLPDADIVLITLTPNPDGSLKLIVTIHNKGNTVLSDIPLDIDFSGAVALRQMLDGPVLPGSKYNYVLSTSIANSGSLRYLCVSVQLEDDVSTGGNRMCTQFRNELFVLDGYPNPTRSILNMEWISGIATSVRISLTDALGRTIMAHETHCLPGLNERTLDLAGLQSGIYYLLVSDGITLNRQRILISSDP